MSSAATPPSRAKWLSTVVVALLCAAPVPGDIGACGQPVQRLDPDVFFASKQAIDCRRCKSCGLSSSACTEACASSNGVKSFPEGCEPLVHDGEVCLRRLLEAGCDEYAAFVADKSPTVPTECDFCPR
jgi:hypothetical protein